MSFEDKMMIFSDSFTSLRARGIIKTYQDFAELLDVSKNSISAAKNGNEEYLTENLISKIKGLMKQYDTEKHVDGYGEPKTKEMTLRDEQGIHLVPTIPYKAYKEIGVDLQEYLNSQSPDLHMSPSIAQFARTDCHYFVGSDAMLPHLHQSDVLALKRMPDQAQVINGEIYVVNSRYNGLIARFVYDDGDHLILKASDEQTRYTPMRLPKDDIFGLYRVLGLVRTNI